MSLPPPRDCPAGAASLSRPAAAGIVAALLLLHTLGVLDHDLWTPDEPRVAAIAREVAEGAWTVPTLNGAPFLEEPPLYVWCAALVYKLAGTGMPPAPRVVSALFGLGGLVAMYFLAADLAGRERGRRVGLLAALALGISFEYFHTAHRVVVDGALVFFTTAAAAAGLRGLRAERGGIRAAWLATSYFLTSLAFMTKGAIGIAVPALFFLAVAAGLRRPGLLRRAYLWAAPLIFLATAGPWFFFLHRRLGAEGFHTLLVDNTLGRVLPAMAGSRGHVRPFHFYLPLLPLHLLPATLFGLGGILRRLRSRGALTEAERGAYDTALIWLLLGLLMLSLATTKRAVYLVPFFPAAALIGGLWLDAFLRGEGGAYERVAGYLLSALLALLAAALAAAPPFLAGAGFRAAFAGSLLGFGAAVGTACAIRRGERGLALAMFTGGLVLTVAYAGAALVPPLDRLKSLGPVSRRIDELVPRERDIFLLDPDETTAGMMSLYAGRRAIELPDAAALERRLSPAEELHVITVDKTEREEHARFEAVRALGAEVLLEDVRPHSRAIRLLRVRRP
jgi:4-amino-4-deoxy-L-arabinose transferase-like glycosyltransferase